MKGNDQSVLTWTQVKKRVSLYNVRTQENQPLGHCQYHGCEQSA